MVLTKRKEELMTRNETIIREFKIMEGMKTAKYEALAVKFGLSKISVIKIILSAR